MLQVVKNIQAFSTIICLMNVGPKDEIKKGGTSPRMVARLKRATNPQITPYMEIHFLILPISLPGTR